MIDTESSEVCGGVELGIQANDEPNISLGEVGEDVLERAR